MYHDINSFHASQMCPEWIEQQNNGLRQTKSLQSEIGLTRMNSMQLDHKLTRYLTTEIAAS